MAWVYVGSTTGVGTSTGYTVSLNGTLTGGIASSPAEGDIVVVVSAFGNTASSAPNVTGNNSGAYTGIGTAIHANDTWDTECRPFYQVMGATPDTSLTITRVTNTAYGGATVVQVWRGVDTASPFIGSAQTSGTNGCVINCPSYNPAVADALIFAAGAGTMAATSNAYTGITGMSNFVTIKGDGSTSDCAAAMATYDYAGVAYDPAAISGGTTSTSSSWAGFTFAFRMYVPPTQGLTQDSTFDDSTDTFYDPTVTVGSVALTQSSRFDDTQAFYAPTVNQSGGSQNLNQDTRFDDSQTFYGPTVTQGGAPQSLTPTLYTNDQSYYAPAVTTSIGLTAGLYSGEQSFYSPTVTSTIGLTPSLYSNTEAFYSPTVTQGGVNLTPNLYENNQTFYGPVVSSGGAILLPDLVTNSQSFYAPTVSPGVVAVEPTLFSNTNVFYAPSVSSGGVQELTFIDHVESGWVESGWVGWPYFNAPQFFEVEVVKGVPPLELLGGGGIPRKRHARDYDFLDPLHWQQKVKETINEVVDEIAQRQIAPEPKKVLTSLKKKLAQEDITYKQEFEKELYATIRAEISNFVAEVARMNSEQLLRALQEQEDEERAILELLMEM